MNPLAFLLLSLFVLEAHGDDVSLEWMSDGISSKLGYYRPIKLELSAVKPARIAKLPENLLNPLFGNISMGPKESPVEAIILLDEPDNGPARLWIDSNGNGWNANLAQQYGAQGIPACWLIDGNSGLIVAGQADLRGAALRPTIERCLASLGKPSATNPVADAGKLNKVPASKPASEDPLVTKARALIKADKLLTVASFNALKKSPKPASIAPANVSTQLLRGREIATRAANAYVRVGWIYLCAKCNCCHVKLAGGYAIAKDTVITAFHVMETPETIKQGEGYPVVARGNDEIIPIVSVLAADEALDAIILRVAASDLHPLALSAGARAGDAAYCFSDPHGAHDYFSSGIINRFYTRPGGSPDNPADQRFNVSVDWAPGSSGAAVLDECANIIGHVARIQSILGKKQSVDSEGHHDDTSPTIMTLHEAVPAKGVLKLIEKMNFDATGAR